MADMSDSPEPSTAPTGPVPVQTETVPPPPPPAAVVSPPLHKPSRLNQVAAWVGIVAGSVFIIAVIFGTGFVLGAHSGDRGFDRHEAVMFKHRQGPPAFQMGPMGEFERGPFVFRGPNFPAPPPGAPGAPGGSEGPGAPAPARP